MPTLPDNFEIPQWLYRRYIWHGLFWAVYFSVTFWQDLKVGFVQQADYWQLSLIAHIPAIIGVYLTTIFGVPYLLYRKKYVQFGAFCLLTSYLIGLLAHWLWKMWTPNLDYIGISTDQLISLPEDGLATALMFVLMSAALKMAKDLAFSAQERVERKAEHLAGELRVLRQQISPHFLLNSLNTIYGLSLTEPEKVPQTVLQLSDLLRFSLYETHPAHISLEKEIEFLENYVQLQQLRASAGLVIYLNLPQQIPTPQPLIAPLLFIVFVENAFKYAVKNERGERFLTIELTHKNGGNALSFYCANSYIPSTQVSTGGLGLVNVRRRLELTYPEKHHLDIRQQNGVWEVQLDIDLTPSA
jgi:two-component system, LytTR family, sensor kinase